jgi:anti-anti-sigma factor
VTPGENFTSFQTQIVAEKAAVVRVVGDLDILCCNAFAEALDGAAQGPGRVIVSLEDCEYCDSSGLLVLIRARKSLGERLVVVVPRDSGLNRLFDITGLSAGLATVVSLDRALRAA